MLRVGLTGGLACGKSTAGEIFRELGARVIDADRIAHELMAPGTKVYKDIVEHFGPGVVNPGGTINRRQLAQEAFGNGRIQELNSIVHPPVIARQEEWLRQLEQSEPHAVGIVEAALLLEAGVGPRFDKLVVVTCRPEQKAGRFAQRQNLDIATAEAEVARRQAAQWPDSEKMAAADYIIDNSGSPEDFRAGVQRVFAELNSLAQKPGQQNSQPCAASSLEPGPPGRPKKT